MIDWTTLIDLSSKWGSEKWSAEVQRANINMLRDALKLVGEERDGLRRRVSELEAELRAAKESNQSLGDANRKLTRESPEIEPNDTEIAILKFLAEHAGDKMNETEAALAFVLNLTQAQVEFFAEHLFRLKLVYRNPFADELDVSSPIVSIEHDGLEWLHKRGLL